MGKKRWLVVLIVSLAGMLRAHATWASAGQSTPPASANEISPELFAPGVISGPANDGSPTFSPDGDTLFFTRSTAGWGVILESHRVNGVWSEPEVAPFSGEWSDSSPGMAPDGSCVVFVSLRPKVVGTNPDGSPKKIMAANLYRANREGTGWGQPKPLPETVNIGPSIWKPSMSLDGTIYFVVIDEKGRKRLFSSQKKNGEYQQAQPLSFSDGESSDVDPEIAPDGSFLVFCSSGRRKEDAKDHLFIVRRKGANWGEVAAIRYAGDTGAGNSVDDDPHLGPDHRTIYFSSDRGVPVKFPRTHEQAVADLKRLESWDNSNSNVWLLPIDSWLTGEPR